MTDQHFRERFKELTGKAPFRWQERLHEAFCKNDWLDWPSVIDLPTGLGKTMVMAIWLIARAQHRQKIPTRLIYVVDRRTVVDQATDLAEEFAFLLAPDNTTDFQKVSERKPDLAEHKKNHAAALAQLRNSLGGAGLAISTLRGQLADNRQWSRDPSRPAIIIGTVDLIGSALLFSGYRSSYKRRPLEAGLLGQDSLLVLDEAHLSKPFEKLICAIGDDGPFQKNRGDKAQGKPMRVIRMSATTAGEDASLFKLENSDLVPEVLDREGKKVRNPIVERFEATKRLTITTLAEKEKLNDKLVDAAIKLAMDESAVGKRIVVFVRKPDDARAIAESIHKHGSTKSKPGPYANAVEVLTGTMRGLERDELVEKPVFKERWLNGDLKPDDPANQSPVFLISTSAGEVGFDLNADHMVCDATSIDSLIQRLGRVNRRGLGDAQIHLFAEPPKKEKDGKPKKLEGLDKAIANTIDLLRDVKDVSPKNIAALKADGWKNKYADACSPEPTTVPLTDILLDAWSMSSITEAMPGRPEVGPWLRGIADDLPQTTIAWRAELDLPGFDQLDLDDVEEWFDTHRILTHETLSVPTHVAAKWFTDRWGKLSEDRQRDVGPRLLIVDRAGLKRIALKGLIDQLSRKSGDTTADIRFADLILPASFGGIERHVGLLNAEAPKKPEDTKDADEPTRQANAKARLVAPDVADVRGRCREKIVKPEDGKALSTPLDPRTVKPAKYARYTLVLEADDGKTVRLVSYVPRGEKLDWGTIRQYLHDHDGKRGHVEQVCCHAHLMLRGVGLQPDDLVWQAVDLASTWHDNGKIRERWQHCACRRPDEPPLGKSGGKMRRDSRGYRHEFGSLREFTDAFKAEKLLDHAGKPIIPDVFDLAMHLIATHHGRGRPHFPKGGFDPDCESRSDEVHTDSIRRFARLQRKYGWWRLAWLENLLRCADAMASADPETEVDDETADGGDP